MKLDNDTHLVDETSKFEGVPSNFFGRLIYGSFGMFPNIVDV